MAALNDKKIVIEAVGLSELDRHAAGSLQEKLHEILSSGIESGALPEGGVLPPERSLADYFGVSRITVTKILDRLEQGGLVRREQGRGTFVQRPPKTPTAVAFLAAVPAHPSLFKALMGMAPIFNESGSQLRILGAFEGLGAEEELVSRALEDGANGFVIFPKPGLFAPSVYRDLVAKKTPIVAIDRYYVELPCDVVTYDDVAAARSVCGSLFADGCERLAILPHREFDVTSVQDRIRGARTAALDHNLDPDQAVIIWRNVYDQFTPSRPNALQEDLGFEKLSQHLNDQPVDGMFAINGDVAERLLYDLSSLAADRPALANLRLAACSHRPLADYGQFPVITAMETADRLGEVAARLILERISSPEMAHRHLTVPMAIDKY